MSGPKKYVRTEGGERVNQPDFEHAAEESQLAGVSQLGDVFIVGADAGQNAYVLSGLEVTCPALNTISVGSGSAILSWKDQGEVEHGVILELPAAKEVILSGSIGGATTFGVFVRFNLHDEQIENRNFWNALAATPVEITRNISTRRVDALEITFKADPETPGTEWMKIAEIIPGDLNPTTSDGITDKRAFYFEGTLANSYAAAADWGAGTDRNVDRATYGLKGLRRFVRAMQNQLEGIVSPGQGWYQNPATLPITPETGATAGLNLLDTKQEAFSRLGDAAVRLGKRMAGNLLPNANATYDLGESTTPRKWKDLHLSGTMSAPTTTSDTFQYSSTQTRTVFIPAINGNGIQVNAAATDRVWRVVGSASTPSISSIFHSASTDDEPWIWDIGAQLPDGAVITAAQMTTSAGATTGAGVNSVRMGLFRMDALSVCESLKVAFYDELTAPAGGVATHALILDAAAPIRTITKATHAHCAWVAARGTANPNLVGVTVTYTYTVIAP